MIKGLVFFFVGLLMYTFGIYLSTKWVIVGTLIGISGGLLLGVSTCSIAMQGHTKKVPK